MSSRAAHHSSSQSLSSRQHEDRVWVRKRRQEHADQFEDWEEDDGHGVDPPSEDSVLDPGDKRGADRAESKPIDRLEAVVFQEGFELLECVTVPHVPAIFMSRHANSLCVAL